MRVTKTIREYIEREVSARLESKHEADKAEAERQEEMAEEFIAACEKAAMEAYDNYFNAHFNEIAEFAEDARERRYNRRGGVCYNYPIGCSPLNEWRNCMKKEKQAIIDDIIITLELGGDKEQLMEMFNKI